MSNDLTKMSLNMQSPEIVRTIAELQAGIFLAKQNPRNEASVLEKIIYQCSRKKLAESAIYSFPKGGKDIKGPSIRLAETLAKFYGNLEFGLKVLGQEGNVVKCLAYCWDLENNVRQMEYFDVRLEKNAKNVISKITDPRDIYEHSSSQGARRLRKCILGIIPSDMLEDAIKMCNETMKNDNQPLIERTNKLVEAFKELKISSEMLENKVGKNIKEFQKNDITELRAVYTSIRDGMLLPEEYFYIEKTKNKNLENTNVTEYEKNLENNQENVKENINL